MEQASDAVLTLDQVAQWTFAGTALAVLGHPVAHSLSPAIHNAALAELARVDPAFAAWRYFRLDVPPEQLAGALDRLHVRGFAGLNLTVPHKVLAVSCLSDVAPAAAALGAVNTLVHAADGWHGHNTDGYGLATALRTELEVSPTGASVILLGAGGAARSAAVECLRRRCTALWIGNRTRARLDDLLRLLEPLAGGLPVRGFDPQSPPAELPAGAIVINATAAGLRTDDPPPVDLTRLPRPGGVYDMIYNPPQTALLRQAAELGLPCANGLSMLVHQGAKSLEIWSGAPASRTAPVMLRAARDALERG